MLGRVLLLGLLIWLSVLAAGAIYRRRTRPEVAASWALALALALCLSTVVYRDPADFRVVTELYVLGALAAFDDRTRALELTGALVAVLWLGLAAYRAVVA